MSAGYTVQRFRDGYALVWKSRDEAGKITRRRRTLRSQDRQSAQAEARQLWQVGDDRSPWTVGRVMIGYIASIIEKPSHKRREEAWKAMRGFFENVDPDLIDEQMCRDYRATRKVSDATARYELLQVSTALKWGRAQKHITAAPAIWLPSTPERQTRHLSRDEFDRFHGGVIADHARTYVMIGLHTVARPSAILDLTWDRVDFMRRQIDYRPPGRAATSKRRTIVPISDDLLPVLQKAHTGRTCEYVIERGGQQVANIKKAFQAASKRSGVHATPYTLRHTGAVWAAEAGIPMAELAQFMGHDDSRTTEKHYARFGPEYLRGVANAIGKRA